MGEHNQDSDKQKVSGGLLRRMLDAMPVCIALVGHDGRILYRSKDAEALFGYTSDEIQSEGDWWQLAFPDKRYRERMKHAWHAEMEIAFRENRKPKPQEWIVTHKDGSKRRIEVNTAIIDHYYVVMFNDITEKNQQEARLLNSEARFKTLAEASFESIVVSSEGLILDFNDQFVKMSGYTREELIGIPIIDLVAPESKWIVDEAIRTQRLDPYEHVMMRKNGQRLWVETRARSVLIGDSLVRIGVLRDITERKQAEEELRFTQYVMDNMSDVAYWITPDARLRYANGAATELLGYTREELVNLSIIDINPTRSPANWKAHWQELRDKKKLTFETIHKTKSGRVIPVEVTANFVEFEGKEYNCAVIRDITERKLADEALRRSEAFLDGVIEHSPISTWIADKSGVYIRQNQACRDTFHTKDDDVIGKYNVLEDEYLQKQGFTPLIRRAFENGEIIRFSLWYDSSQVETIVIREPIKVFLEVTIWPVFDADGQVTNVVGQQVDLTDRKRAENALQESEETLRLATSAANQGTFDLNLRTGEAKTSSQHAIMLGFDPADFHETYLQWLGRIHPDDQKRVDDCFKAFMHGDITTYEVESRQRTSDGEWKWILSTGKIIERDSDGNPTRMVGINTDVTERKRVEENLRWREEEEVSRKLEAEAAAKRFMRDIVFAVTDGKLNLISYVEAEHLCRENGYAADINEAETIGAIRKEIADAAVALHMPQDRIDALVIAVGEAAVNALKHAGGGTVSVHSMRDKIRISIRDQGEGIESLILPSATLMTRFSTKSSMGFGYALILASVDTVYLATGRQGTFIILEQMVKAMTSEINLAQLTDVW